MSSLNSPELLHICDQIFFFGGVGGGQSTCSPSRVAWSNCLATVWKQEVFSPSEERVPGAFYIIFSSVLFLFVKLFVHFGNKCAVISLGATYAHNPKKINKNAMNSWGAGWSCPWCTIHPEPAAQENSQASIFVISGSALSSIISVCVRISKEPWDDRSHYVLKGSRGFYKIQTTPVWSNHLLNQWVFTEL